MNKNEFVGEKKLPPPTQKKHKNHTQLLGPILDDERFLKNEETLYYCKLVRIVKAVTEKHVVQSGSVGSRGKWAIRELHGLNGNTSGEDRHNHWLTRTGLGLPLGGKKFAALVVKKYEILLCKKITVCIYNGL